MGCFNQVCLLTRAPITCGDAVVVWEEIRGPWFNSETANGHGLLFGLPQRAVYDDYGGAEDYVDTKLFELHERAWQGQTLYRTHRVKANNNWETLYIARSRETMSRKHALAPLFYNMEELNPMDVFEEGYEKAYLQKMSRADERAKNILETIGERLGLTELPIEKAACLAACFHIVQDEVGPQLAWAVWNIISQDELFAHRELCMVRAEAYDYLVNTVNNNTISEFQVANSKKTFREYLVQHWAAWEDKKASSTSSNPVIANILLRDERLMPMARPWGLEDKPIESYFWNAIGYDDLVTQLGKDVFLDAMVFTRALHDLSSPMKAEEGGGQHTDWKLHADMMKAVHRKVREDGPLKRDWEPYM